MFYGVMGWYLDNVVPNNRGVPKNVLFFLEPSFWFPSVFGKKAKRRLTTTHQNVNNGANSEKEMILELEEKGDIEGFEGLRCLGLSKTYNSIMSGTPTEALKGVYFQIRKGELLGVMGHNGAGKSTLINVLCGLVHHDGGNARIFDADIEDRLQYCRKRMGVVS